jgi:hypothetical protein
VQGFDLRVSKNKTEFQPKAERLVKQHTSAVGVGYFFLI